MFDEEPLEPDDLVKALLQRQPAPYGSLRFWGAWFGRPGDHDHTMVAGRVVGPSIVLEFDTGEVLTIESPERAVLRGRGFVVRDAKRVRLEGQPYGSSEPGRWFWELVATPRGVVVTPHSRREIPTVRSEDAVQFG